MIDVGAIGISQTSANRFHWLGKILFQIRQDVLKGESEGNGAGTCCQSIFLVVLEDSSHKGLERSRGGHLETVPVILAKDDKTWNRDVTSEVQRPDLI